MKKKLTALLLACLVCCTAALPVFAQGTTHQLADGLLTVTIPEEADVMAREIAEDDPVWEGYGFSKEDWMTSYYEAGYLLNAFWPEKQLELSVYQEKGVAALIVEDEFDRDAALFWAGDFMANGLGDYRVENSEVLLINDRYFVELFLLAPENTLNAKLYMTACGEDMWSLAFYDYALTFDREDDALIQQILENARFEEKEAAPAKDADPVLFTDPLTGTQIALPPNWEITSGPDYDEENDSMVTAFEDSDSSGQFVVYVSSDFYELGLVSRRGDARSEEFDREYISNIMACEEDEIAQKYIGNKLYHYYESGDFLSGPETHLCRMENGIVHYFGVSCWVDDPAFATVEAMIESMVYPEFPAEETKAPASPLERVLTKALGGAIVGGVLGLAGLVYAWVNGKRNKADPEPAPAQPAPQQQPGAPRVRFCSHCGAPLVEGSRFCAACGTEVHTPGGEEE